jgi:peroxiredoxin Q/BCP
MGTARVTFVINEKGVIEEIIEKVDTKNHTSQILKEDGSPTVAAKKIAKKVAPKKAAKKGSKK